MDRAEMERYDGRSVLPLPLVTRGLAIGYFEIWNSREERRYQDEDVVFYVQVRRPERRSLADLDAFIHTCKDAPVESVKFFRRALRLSKVPWPFRRLAWWWALHVSGKLRAHNFGTFSVTSTAAEGAGALALLPLVTATLHYGLFDDRGHLPARITFDHRVLDGAFVARGLVELEEVLQTTILEELALPTEAPEKGFRAMWEGKTPGKTVLTR